MKKILSMSVRLFIKAFLVLFPIQSSLNLIEDSCSRTKDTVAAAVSTDKRVRQDRPAPSFLADLSRLIRSTVLLGSMYVATIVIGSALINSVVIDGIVAELKALSPLILLIAVAALVSNKPLKKYFIIFKSKNFSDL